MGRAYVQLEIGNRAGQARQQRRPVDALDLDHRETVRQRVVDLDGGFDGEGAERPRPLPGRLDGRKAHLAAQHVLDQPADPPRPPQFVGIVVELAFDLDDVERAAVGGGEDVRAVDRGARARTGGRDHRQKARMVLRQDRDLGHRLEGVGAHRARQLLAFGIGGADEFGVAELIVRIDRQQIIVVMQPQIGVALLGRPVGEALGEALGERGALVRGAALAAGLGKTAGQRQFGLGIEGAQELALPAVPDARADPANVAHGQDEQQLEPLDRLDAGDEVLDRLAVGQVARLRRHAHQEMVLDQPGDGRGLLGRKAQPRAKPARDLGAGDGMVLGPPLGDVVQEQGDVEDRPLAPKARHQRHRQRVLLLKPALFDVGEHADRPDQMLVDRVVMIHVELHHGDDAAEIGDEAAEHARLVHAAQIEFGIVARGQDPDEQRVGVDVGAQRPVDQPQRAAHQLERLGMVFEPVAVGEMEHADQIDRIAREDMLIGDVDALAVDHEVLDAPDRRRPAREGQRLDQARQGRRVLDFLLLQRGAEDPRQVAHILCDQEIVLHEALDVLEPGMGLVAEPLGEVALDVEGQPFLGLAGQEMQVAPHRPQKVLALDEEGMVPAREDAHLDQFVAPADPVDIFGDPEQRLQIPQAALAVLDVRLDHEARLAHALVARVALGKLGLDELRGRPGDDVPVEALHQFVEQGPVAGQEARFEDGRRNGDVGLRQPDAIVDPARGVTDLQPHVPQHVEHVFGQLLAERGLLVGQDEQKVDVRARRQRAAPVTADGGQRDAFALRQVGDLEHMGQREVVDRPDDRVLQVGEAPRAAMALAVGEEPALGLGAALAQHALEMRQHPGPRARAVAAGRKGGQRRADRLGIGRGAFFGDGLVQDQSLFAASALSA